MITHDLGVVSEVARRVVVMYAGLKIEEALVDDLFQSPLHPYTCGLLTASPRFAGGRDSDGRRVPLAEIAGTMPAMPPPLPFHTLARAEPWAVSPCPVAAGSRRIVRWRMRNAMRNRRRWWRIGQGIGQRAGMRARCTMADRLLVVDGLAMHYRVGGGHSLRAVDDASFHIGHGETLGLVGESGCGKSTVGKAILRLVEPSGGSVRLQGVEITTLNSAALRAQRRNMQVISRMPTHR